MVKTVLFAISALLSTVVIVLISLSINTIFSQGAPKATGRLSVVPPAKHATAQNAAPTSDPLMVTVIPGVTVTPKETVTSKATVVKKNPPTGKGSTRTGRTVLTRGGSNPPSRHSASTGGGDAPRGLSVRQGNPRAGLVSRSFEDSRRSQTENKGVKNALKKYQVSHPIRTSANGNRSRSDAGVVNRALRQISQEERQRVKNFSENLIAALIKVKKESVSPPSSQTGRSASLEKQHRLFAQPLPTSPIEFPTEATLSHEFRQDTNSREAALLSSRKESNGPLEVTLSRETTPVRHPRSYWKSSSSPTDSGNGDPQEKNAFVEPLQNILSNFPGREDLEEASREARKNLPRGLPGGAGSNQTQSPPSKSSYKDFPADGSENDLDIYTGSSSHAEEEPLEKGSPNTGSSAIHSKVYPPIQPPSELQEINLEINKDHSESGIKAAGNPSLVPIANKIRNDYIDSSFWCKSIQDKCSDSEGGSSFSEDEAVIHSVDELESAKNLGSIFAADPTSYLHADYSGYFEDQEVTSWPHGDDGKSHGSLNDGEEDSRDEQAAHPSPPVTHIENRSLLNRSASWPQYSPPTIEKEGVSTSNTGEDHSLNEIAHLAAELDALCRPFQQTFDSASGDPNSSKDHDHLKAGASSDRDLSSSQIQRSIEDLLEDSPADSDPTGEEVGGDEDEWREFVSAPIPIGKDQDESRPSSTGLPHGSTEGSKDPRCNQTPPPKPEGKGQSKKGEEESSAEEVSTSSELSDGEKSHEDDLYEDDSEDPPNQESSEDKSHSLKPSSSESESDTYKDESSEAISDEGGPGTGPPAAKVQQSTLPVVESRSQTSPPSSTGTKQLSDGPTLSNTGPGSGKTSPKKDGRTAQQKRAAEENKKRADERRAAKEEQPKISTSLLDRHLKTNQVGVKQNLKGTSGRGRKMNPQPPASQSIVSQRKQLLGIMTPLPDITGNKDSGKARKKKQPRPQNTPVKNSSFPQGGSLPNGESDKDGSTGHEISGEATISQVVVSEKTDTPSPRDTAMKPRPILRPNGGKFASLMPTGGMPRSLYGQKPVPPPMDPTLLPTETHGVPPTTDRSSDQAHSTGQLKTLDRAMEILRNTIPSSVLKAIESRKERRQVEI